MKDILQKKIADLLSLKCWKRSFLPVIFLVALTITLTTCKDDPSVMPKLNTLQTVDADITSTSATLKGDILILGNMKIIEYGIEISKSMLFSSPQTKGYITPAIIGTFQVEFTNLDPTTLYYYKAYVLINTANVYSQNYEHFTTK